MCVDDVQTWARFEKTFNCCGERECFTTQEYFRATALDHNVLQLQIRLHADYRADVPNFHANGYRKAAYRQYTLSQYGYLGIKRH